VCVADLCNTRCGEPVAPRYSDHVTLAWFVIWFVANNLGGSEPITFDPVNGWAGTLILAAAIDLARAG
jgi:hypothetical protein